MPGDLGRHSIPDALHRLFGVRGCEKLRNLANGFVRNKLIPADKIARPQRSAVYIRDVHLPTLHNAILLHALIGDAKAVKEMFDDRAARKRQGEAIAALLMGRNALLGIALQNQDAQALVDMVLGEADLRVMLLPNPFATLPQMTAGTAGGLVAAVLAQAASLSAGDSILLAYLQGDLATARERVLVAKNLPDDLLPLRQKILADYQEAADFDDFLDSLRPRAGT